jgi:tetratricopeptide (TPR) repeat protein
MDQARAKALGAQASLLTYVMQSEGAHSAAQECLELYRKCGDSLGELKAILVLAEVTSGLDDLPQTSETAIKLAQQALRLSESLGDVQGRAASLLTLGEASRKPQRSYKYVEEAISLYRQIKDWSNLALCLSIRGRKALVAGDFHIAERYLKEATLLYRKLKNKTWLGAILQLYGRLSFYRGDFDQALAYMKESIEAGQEAGNRMVYLWSRTHWGYFMLRQGDVIQARDIFAEVLQEFFSDKIGSGVVFVSEGIASLFVIVGKPASAARLIGWADITREKIGDPRPPIEQKDVDKIIAACLAKMGEVAFSDAYDEGQKMTRDEAVAFALNE